MTEQRKIRVAAVGLGWVTTHRHLTTMSDSSDFNVVGVIDSRPGRAREVAAKFGCQHHAESSDLAQVDWLDEVEAITIGTSPFSHHDLVTAALSLDKHVLTEKPFAMKVAEGEAMVALAKERDRVLAVVHNFQFAQSTQRLEADIQQGLLGTVRGVTGWQLGNPNRRLPEWFEDLPLGLYYDESPHLFYLLRRLSPGPLTLANATVFPSTMGKVTPSSIEATYSCATEAGPLPVRLSLNFESPVSEWHVTVLGEKCLGDIDVFRDIYLRLPNDGIHDARTVVRTSLTACMQHWWQHLPNGIKHVTGRMRYGNETVFGRFAEAVRTNTPPRDISGEDALTVLKMQHDLVDNHIAL